MGLSKLTCSPFTSGYWSGYWWLSFLPSLCSISVVEIMPAWYNARSRPASPLDINAVHQIYGTHLSADSLDTNTRPDLVAYLSAAMFLCWIARMPLDRPSITRHCHHYVAQAPSPHGCMLVAGGGAGPRICIKWRRRRYMQFTWDTIVKVFRG